MKTVILAFVFVAAAFCQCGPNATLKPIGGGKQSCVPKSTLIGTDASGNVAIGTTTLDAVAGVSTPGLSLTGAGTGYMNMLEGTTPSNPAASNQRLYFNSSTHHLNRVDSSGSVVDVEGAAVSHYYTSGGATGIGPTTFTPSGTHAILDNTASTGSTVAWFGADGSGTFSGTHISPTTNQYNFVGGTTAPSSTTPLIRWMTSGGTVYANLEFGGSGANFNFTRSFSVGANCIATGNCDVSALAGSGYLLASAIKIAWSGTTNAQAAADTSISKCAAGVVCVGTGASGSKAGRIAVDNSTPGASSDACTAQSIWADASFVYVCTASGVIKRAALSTF